MYSYGSDNINLLYPPTSRECSSKLECYHVINHHCAFCGGRTPHQMLWYTSIRTSYFSGPSQHLELHMFGDSSQDVFSAVGFLRAQVTCTSGEIIRELAFVLGKARVASMKVMTAPKLELQAALLAARLKREICRALTVTVDKVFMWTDSTIVLQWINSTNKHPIFIANRVSEILENTSVDQWNHVVTCDNMADAGTRGMSAEVLRSSSWVRRPDFLRISNSLLYQILTSLITSSSAL